MAQWTVAPRLTALRVPAGGRTVLLVDVGNGGPAGEYALVVTGAEWASVRPATQRVDAGATGLFVVTLAPPVELPPGRYPLGLPSGAVVVEVQPAYPWTITAAEPFVAARWDEWTSTSVDVTGPAGAHVRVDAFIPDSPGVKFPTSFEVADPDRHLPATGRATFEVRVLPGGDVGPFVGVLFDAATGDERARSGEVPIAVAPEFPDEPPVE